MSPLRLRVLLEPRFGATYAQLVEWATRCEGAGLDAFFRSDHYLGTDRENRDYRPTDAWTTLGGLARATSRIRLGTLMTASTFRLPGPLAMAVASVDQMSEGRIELGIGAAWNEREHEAYGVPFFPTGERFDRLEEQLAILTGLWTGRQGRPFSFEGRHFQLRGATAFPAVVQRPHPPIVIGGSGPRRTPLLAARYAAEFNVAFGVGRAEGIANFRKVCDEVGRDPGSVRLSTVVPLCLAPTKAAAEALAAPLELDRLLSLGVVGTPDELVEHLAGLAALGIDTVYFHCFDAAAIDQVDLLGAEVLGRA